MILKEACVGSYSESKTAVAGGAHRLELCDNLAVGGTTPSYGTLALAQEKLNTPLMVMIRPRGGNFIYSEEEIEIMKRDIALCKKLGVQGVVFGVLTESNQIDSPVLIELVACARPLQTTFHMAFDAIEDQEGALETLIELGIDRVLTKGGNACAEAGVTQLRRLVEIADKRIVIIAGGGVHEGNYETIAEQTGVTEVHGTKIVGMI